MSQVHLLVTIVIALIMILSSSEKFSVIDRKIRKPVNRKKNLRRSKNMQKRLKKEKEQNCLNLNSNTENVTYNINRRAYCRFIDSKQLANNNDVKSWSQ